VGFRGRRFMVGSSNAAINILLVCSEIRPSSNQGKGIDIQIITKASPLVVEGSKDSGS
jgi:hypothetical protein